MHRYASFLSAPGANSKAGGYKYISKPSPDLKNPPHKPPPLNRPIHVKCTTLNNIPASAMVAELGALFFKCHQGATMIIALEEMVHQQPTTPLVTNSTTSDGFVNDNTQQRKSRAIDMRFYWVRNRFRQGHYLVYWAIRKDNLVDCFTKHHLIKNQCSITSIYLVPKPDSSKHT